jgi:nucleolar GTP-binding protein
MNFQNLAKIEPYTFYLDVAFSNAKNKADMARSGKFRDRLAKSKAIELEKIRTISALITKQLNRILTSFPFLDDLHPFYRELVKCTIDYDSTKKALGAVKWVSEKVEMLSDKTRSEIKRTRELQRINVYRREFYGRISSLIKQIKQEFVVLEESRKILKIFPVVKTSLFTVALTGFPNIGKTTLLYKLTGSKPEIDNYAFTTRSINVGYIAHGDTKVQVLDTPGTLNRFHKMNNLERQAFLAMKYCSQLLVYVFDLTEPFPLEEQEKLFETIKALNAPVIVYLSKTDILDKKIVESFQKRYKDTITNIEILKKEIFTHSEKFRPEEEIQEE